MACLPPSRGVGGELATHFGGYSVLWVGWPLGPQFNWWEKLPVHSITHPHRVTGMLFWGSAQRQLQTPSLGLLAWRAQDRAA